MTACYMLLLCGNCFPINPIPQIDAPKTMACLPIVLMSRFCKFQKNKTVNCDLQTDVGRGGQEQAELANYAHEPLFYLYLLKSGNIICKHGCAKRNTTLR